MGIEEIVVGRVGLQYDTHIRNLLVELRQLGDQPARGQRRYGSHREPAARRGLRIDLHHRVAEHAQRRLDPIEQLASGFGQRDAAATAQEQYDAQP
ncbi:hypothetical protein WJ970_33395 [Achromobacter xylosoxidans]